MPKQDGSGPFWGGGPGAGFSAGRCGAGRLFCRRRFWGYWPSTKEESEMLEEDAKFLKKNLAAIEQRMTELKKAK